MKILKIFFFIGILFSACGQKTSNFKSDASYDFTSAKEIPPPLSSEVDELKLTGEKDKVENIPQKLIKIATISVEVNDYKTSRPLILQTVQKYKGYISGESENRYSSQISNSFTIRVPKENFDSLLEEISTLAKEVTSKNVNLQDVTEEFIDISSRLRNKKEVEKQYLEILKSAKTIQDILAVNEQIRQIREEIDAKEGRLKYLESQTSFSTINLSVYQHLGTDYGFFNKIIDGIKGGWQGLLVFIVGLFYLWPFWLILGAIFYFVRRYLKRKKMNKQLENQEVKKEQV